MTDGGGLKSPKFSESYKNCCLCPRECGVNRAGASGSMRSGFCGQTARLKVAYVGPHFGEEPPIAGRFGSGTVFFTGCTLKCSFCQNYQISRQGLGTHMSTDQLFSKIRQMIESTHVHNINFVTPDPFFPHVFEVVSRLRKNGPDLPMVYNLSGYQAVHVLKRAETYADIYLPDFKYGDSSLAGRLSKCPDYTRVALEAISEMLRQKGYLHAFSEEEEVAKKGVLVRHLVLPGHLENSRKALTSLRVEFGRDLPVSLMSQYHPVLPQRENSLNRRIIPEEFDQVFAFALQLGFGHLFVQFPQWDLEKNPGKPSFLPDFRQKGDPFNQKGIVRNDCRSLLLT